MGAGQAGPSWNERGGTGRSDSGSVRPKRDLDEIRYFFGMLPTKVFFTSGAASICGTWHWVQK